MSTILEELTKYRLVLTEMDQPRREKCLGCGRDKMKKQLRPIKGKDGLYCQICHIPYGRKKEVKEDRNSQTVGNIDRLLELLNEYAEKINQLSMLGKSTEKYQIMMDKIEETIGSYPDGQQRLDDFWREYNDSFDDVYESTVVAESKCKFCHKPVELSPSAAARAKKFGGSASDYTKLFPNHSDCELANRKKDTSDLMARKRKENADSQVILKRTMKEYVNPSDLPEIETESKGIELGKHNAMEELDEIVARIPANQEIPYAEFGKTLVGLHRTFKKGSDPKVVEFTRGWNSILQKVNAMLPKSRTEHLTKDELQSVITFVGEKELNWN